MATTDKMDRTSKTNKTDKANKTDKKNKAGRTGKSADMILIYLIELLEGYLLEINDTDEDFPTGEKYAYVECLEIIQQWDKAREAGLDYDIEERFPILPCCRRSETPPSRKRTQKDS